MKISSHEFRGWGQLSRAHSYPQMLWKKAPIVGRNPLPARLAPPSPKNGQSAWCAAALRASAILRFTAAILRHSEHSRTRLGVGGLLELEFLPTPQCCVKLFLNSCALHLEPGGFITISHIQVGFDKTLVESRELGFERGDGVRQTFELAFLFVTEAASC